MTSLDTQAQDKKKGVDKTRIRKEAQKIAEHFKRGELSRNSTGVKEAVKFISSEMRKNALLKEAEDEGEFKVAADPTERARQEADKEQEHVIKMMEQERKEELHQAKLGSEKRKLDLQERIARVKQQQNQAKQQAGSDTDQVKTKTAKTKQELAQFKLDQVKGNVVDLQKHDRRQLAEEIGQQFDPNIFNQLNIPESPQADPLRKSIGRADATEKLLIKQFLEENKKIRDRGFFSNLLISALERKVPGIGRAFGAGSKSEARRLLEGINVVQGVGEGDRRRLAAVQAGRRAQVGIEQQRRRDIATAFDAFRNDLLSASKEGLAERKFQFDIQKFLSGLRQDDIDNEIRKTDRELSRQRFKLDLQKFRGLAAYRRELVRASGSRLKESMRQFGIAHKHRLTQEARRALNQKKNIELRQQEIESRGRITKREAELDAAYVELRINQIDDNMAGLVPILGLDGQTRNATPADDNQRTAFNNAWGGGIKQGNRALPTFDESGKGFMMETKDLLEIHKDATKLEDRKLADKALIGAEFNIKQFFKAGGTMEQFEDTIPLVDQHLENQRPKIEAGKVLSAGQQNALRLEKEAFDVAKTSYDSVIEFMRKNGPRLFEQVSSQGVPKEVFKDLSAAMKSFQTPIDKFSARAIVEHEAKIMVVLRNRIKNGTEAQKREAQQMLRLVQHVVTQRIGGRR